MFNVGDYAQHRTTGLLGQVDGYGHKIVNGVYLPTIKVRVVDTSKREKSFVEDLSSVWLPPEEVTSDMLAHKH